MGELVYKENALHNNSTVDINSLATGINLLELSTGNNVFTTMFSKK